MIPAPSIDVHALMRGLVHELRNPLAAILTASNLLQGAPGLDEESAMLLEIVSKESRRMNRIMTEFASFVKTPAAHPEDFDIARTLRRLIEVMRRDDTLPHPIEVRDDLPAQLHTHADPVLTEQAFHHLFNNAIEAMPGGGTLHLHARSNDPHVAVFLDDSGAGLPDDSLEIAFQPFFSTKPAATGLGLSIAEALIRASGGQISLHHRPDDAALYSTATRGARVRVDLPRGES